MMTLNTYTYWDTLQFSNSEQSTFYEAMPQQVVPPNLQHSFPYLDNYLDSTDDFLNPPEVHPSSDEPLIPLTHHDIFPTHEVDYNLLPCIKRQKCCYDQVQSSPQEFTTTLPSNFLDGFVVPHYENCFSVQTEGLQQQQLCFEVPEHVTCVDVEREKKGNERTISSQSVAARERRRKITEKTQGLGKLVPGGPKMNTAEMLNAAAKYVKFLQTQLDMLQLINTLQEDKAAAPSEDLHALVVSPLVQEKLYTEGMCFVPKQIVTTLTNHEHVQSKPTIMEDLKQLIGKANEKKQKQE